MKDKKDKDFEYSEAKKQKIYPKPLMDGTYDISNSEEIEFHHEGIKCVLNILQISDEKWVSGGFYTLFDDPERSVSYHEKLPLKAKITYQSNFEAKVGIANLINERLQIISIKCVNSCFDCKSNKDQITGNQKILKKIPAVQDWLMSLTENPKPEPEKQNIQNKETKEEMTTEIIEIENKLLSKDESEHLKELEIVIRTGLQTFYEVGKALLEIRDSKLYRQEYRTFEEYCKQKWNITANYTRRLIQSTEIIQNLESVPIGTLPETESQTRPLSKLEPEVQREVWNTLTGAVEKITAKVVEEKVKEYIPLNETVKELKQPKNLFTPAFAFNSEKELIEKAKELTELKENEKISELENEIEKQKIISKSEQDALKRNHISEVLKTIDDVNYWKNQVQEKEKLENELKKAKDELEKIKSKENSLSDREAKVKEQESKIKDTLIQIHELEKKKQEFFSDADNLKKVSDVYVKSRDFFQKEIFYLAALELREGTKKAMQKEVRELINMVDDWRNALEQKFFNDNIISEVR